MNLQTLMIDMDNVITNGNILNCIEEFYKQKPKIEEITEYKLVQELTKVRRKEFWDFMKTKDFYASAPLLDNCYEVLEKLNQKYDLYIVTSYLWQEEGDLSGKCLSEKYKYLKNKLPFISQEKYIFTTNKTIIHFDIAIDDKLENLQNADKKILFDAWHNKNVKDASVTRVTNWKEIEKELL